MDIEAAKLSIVGQGKRTGEAKLKRRLAKLTNTALDALEEILEDSDAKAADRISAAKLTFDILKQSTGRDGAEDGVVRVVFDGIPKEYAE